MVSTEKCTMWVFPQCDQVRRHEISTSKPTEILSYKTCGKPSITTAYSFQEANPHCQGCPVEMCWHTVTHGRRSEGEAGEWSG